MTRESTKHPEPLLHRTPEAAVRVLALELLDGAADAAADFSAEEHEGALHRFRVALRRLRTLLKAYREHLPRGVSKKRRHALRDLADSTGAARDAEVELEWLARQRDRLEPRARKACMWLAERIEARRDGAYAEIRHDTLADFRDLEARLCKALARDDTLPAARRSYARSAGRRVRRAGAELVAALPNARAATDVEAAHDARIRAKRLRYLVEPLADTPVGPRARRLVRSLKELQDVLGELHDLHVLADDIGASLVEHAAERARSRHAALYATNGTPRAPDLAPGLRALDRRARDEIERRFEELHARWSGARLATLAAEVSALVAALDRHAERARRSAARVRRRPLATRRP